jgi:hypothetical protein
MGAATVEETVDVPLGDVAKVYPILKLGTVQETVVVTAAIIPPALATTQQSANFTGDAIRALSIGRRPFEIAELAAGVTDNTPNVGQIAIAGAFGFDSLFLIDGVDTNDNLFGYSHDLFIEDAIQETQVLTSGISAEYGRFGGGVVNVITRSGGNSFSGSFRSNLAKPSWTDETPFEKERNQERSDQLSHFHEATFGGPLLRDRIWFFNADRYESSRSGNALSEVGTPYSLGNDNKRFEIKLTGTTPGARAQRVTGTFLNNATKQSSRPSINSTFSMDPATLTDPDLPNNLWVVNWNGVLSQELFGTFQWSRKAYGIRNHGGTSTALIDSPYLTRGALPGVPANRHFNAPYFSSADPEDRNNRQYTASLAYFLGNPTVGRHDLKGGFEHFRSSRTGGNSQSATGYVFRTDYLLGADGRPVLDPVGHPIPVWGGNAQNPAAAATWVENYLAVQGATLNINTLSLYAQDRWIAHDRLTVDLGVRYERVRSEATGGIVGADTDAVLPRLGVSFNVEGDGRTLLQGTYARYSGRFTERYFGRNTPVGNPSLLERAYVGPNGAGRDFAPALDLRNYTIIGGEFPTANVFFDEDLSSPRTSEFTLSVGRTLGTGGYIKGIYVWRKPIGFIEDLINDASANGKVTVVNNGRTFGTFDRVLWANTDSQKREYQGLQLLSRVRFGQRLFAEGHWTVQLENHGNFEGEAGNQPGNGSIWFDYPELFNAARYYPDGRLDEFQRHKVRIWTTYAQTLGRLGSVDISPIWRINSGRSYSLVANGVALSAVQLARNPGYARTASTGASAPLFFDERGSESFDGYALLDLSVRYSIPLWRTIDPWLQVLVFNAFNNQKLIQWNTSVTPDRSGPLDELGQPTRYVPGANFGRATSTAHYPVGRTFRLAFGVRF